MLEEECKIRTTFELCRRGVTVTDALRLFRTARRLRRLCLHYAERPLTPGELRRLVEAKAVLEAADGVSTQRDPRYTVAYLTVEGATGEEVKLPLDC